MSFSFCVIGEIGSGKTTTVEYLRKKFPDHELITSSRLWNGVAGRELTHYEAIIFQREIIAKHGEKFLVNILVKKIEDVRKSAPEKQFIVDGIRSQENLDALKKLFGKSIIFIGMVADKSTRHDRLAGRDGEDKFLERQGIEDRQFPLESMIQQCDVRITNNFTEKESLYKEIEKITRQL